MHRKQKALSPSSIAPGGGSNARQRDEDAHRHLLHLVFGDDPVRQIPVAGRHLHHQPHAHLIIFGVGFGSLLRFGPTGTTNYINFLAPGILGMTVIFTSMYSAVSIIFDKQFGFLKEILVAPVSRTSIVLGKALGVTTQAAVQGFIILGLSYFLGVTISGTLGLAAALALILVTMFFVGMGFVEFGISIATRLETIEGYQAVANLLVLPIFFLSGAFFPLTGLPDWMQAIITINPLAYGVDAMRYAMTGLHL